MDSLVTAAARALAAGDPIGALARVALREDAPALALRGIAMAQLGDLVRARLLMRRAARAFSHRETVARARCLVAEAEIALASRDLSFSPRALDTARHTLEAHGDRTNAAHARHLAIRRLVLIGRLDEAERGLLETDAGDLPAAIRVSHELALAGIALRRLQTRVARAALDRARRAAQAARIPALAAEVERASALLKAPAARAVTPDGVRTLRLADVEALVASKALVVDACRHVVRHAGRVISLVSRPVLFALARALGEAWPGDVSRETLIARAFAGRDADESHRARLRVEIGRLRRVLRTVADLRATKSGFALAPRRTRQVVVLAWPADVDEDHAAVLGFLSDGEAWSSSSLALALGLSQRSVQRALDALAGAGKAQSFGRGRARRWTSPMPGFTTPLLLPPPLPIA